jgi:hypothetical protein
MNIINSKDISLHQRGEYFVQDLNIKLNVYADTISITDLTNALRVGKTCKRVSINHIAYDDYEAVPKFTKVYLTAIQSLFDDFNDGDSVELRDVHVYCTEYKGIQVFSPFNLKYMKPLTEIPKKWTVKHALRALLNGQYTEFNKTLRLSDDYAYDSASNFGKGVIKDVTMFCSDIIANKGGWRVTEENGIVHVMCCHFDYNEFTLKI